LSNLRLLLCARICDNSYEQEKGELQKKGNRP